MKKFQIIYRYGEMSYRPYSIIVQAENKLEAESKAAERLDNDDTRNLVIDEVRELKY